MRLKDILKRLLCCCPPVQDTATNELAKETPLPTTSLKDGDSLAMIDFDAWRAQYHKSQLAAEQKAHAYRVANNAAFTKLYNSERFVGSKATLSHALKRVLPALPEVSEIQETARYSH